MRLSSLFLFVAAVAWIPQTYAWGTVGHEVVATIAQMHLHPSVMPKLCDILELGGDRCHLASVATWADRIRNQGKYRWTGPLHYINAVDDYPRASCAFPGPQGWQGRTHINVLNAIRNTTSVLQEFEGFRSSGIMSEEAPIYVQDALKFLIHFIGDMHQPLHLTGRNRGGNGDKVAFDGRTTNLHSVWDSLLISERIRTLSWNYTQPLPLPDVERHLRDTIYDPYIRRLVWEGLLGKWQYELDTWLDCPSPSSLERRQRLPLSTLQYVLSFFSLGSKGNERDESGDGLGVDDDTLCPYAWAKPIHRLNCELVFPLELDEARFFNRFFPHALEEDANIDDEDEEDVLRRRKSHYFELDTPEYNGQIKKKWIVEKLLAQGGIRLAGVLNWIFAEVSEEGLERRHLTL